MKKLTANDKILLVSFTNELLILDEAVRSDFNFKTQPITALTTFIENQLTLDSLHQIVTVFCKHAEYRDKEGMRRPAKFCHPSSILILEKLSTIIKTGQEAKTLNDLLDVFYKIFKLSPFSRLNTLAAGLVFQHLHLYKFEKVCSSLIYTVFEETAREKLSSLP